MELPSISVVTPVLNGGRFLAQAVRSVLDQGEDLHEYFVQDGGSRDETLSIIRGASPALTGWVSGPDAGQSDALNRAFDRATGDLLGWMNADDFYEPGAFRHVRELMAAHPRAVAVVGSAWMLQPDGTRIKRSPRDVTLAGLLNWRENWIAQPAVFFRREAWEQVAPLDNSLELAMDFDLWCRLLRVGEFMATDRVLATYRQHADAKCFAQPERMYDEIRRVTMRHAARDLLCEQYDATHRELRRVDELCESLLIEYVRGKWQSLPGEVVLFGAGSHTSWLLGVVAGAGRTRVRAILDDNAEAGQQIAGIAVVRPDALTQPPPVVVLSTDTVQAKLRDRCETLFGDASRVVDLYAGLRPGPFPKSDRLRAGWA